MSSLVQDIRYAARTMRRSLSFTFIAVLCLALGIGATSTIFGIVDALFFRPPPGIGDPGRIVRPYITRDSGSMQARDYDAASFPDYLDIRDNARSLSGFAAFAGLTLSVGQGASAEHADGIEVTGNYFTVLRVRPALGRFFVAEEDNGPGSPPAAVISYRFWQRQFGGDPAVLGKRLLVDGHPYPIVGVAPPGFYGIDPGSPAIWIPFAQHQRLGNSVYHLTERMSMWIHMVGRLAPGVTQERAETDLGAIMRHAAESTPMLDPTPEVTLGPILAARGPSPSRQAQLSRWLALAAILVLAIACANAANLLLARAAARRKEVAIRLSVGAGRWRLVRQLLTESVLLALLGAGGGLLLAWWAVDLLPTFGLPPLHFFTHGRVLVFAVAAAVGCGMLFGLAPALWATRTDLAAAMKEGVREGMDRRSRLRSSLMVVQVALAVVLLTGAGLFVHSLRNVQAIQPGFDLTHLLHVSVDLKLAGYNDTASAAFYARAREAVSALPGVQGATVTTITPLAGGAFSWVFRVPDQETSSPDSGQGSADSSSPSGDFAPTTLMVGPDYFATLGTSILQGRDFRPSDRAASEPVVIVSEQFARHYWPRESAIGQCVDLGSKTKPKCYTVVGVVADAKYVQLEEKPRAAFFVPMAQAPFALAWDHSLLIRTPGDPEAVIPALRRSLQALAPNLPYIQAEPLTDVLRPELQRRLMAAAMFGVFGLVALMLAAIGLYGVVSYAVEQRTHEMGIRMALGAQQTHVLRLVIGQGAMLTVVGLVIGVVGAFAAARLITHFLFGVSATDPVTFAGVCLLLAAVAALASYLPARRATRVDPIIALRSE
ncbi:MAG TPA: ABC transporter permease [Gemmatimonadaceae bacterium]|nr:ABC transporter permease [Gemmatimonadaceae bacterium]